MFFCILDLVGHLEKLRHCIQQKQEVIRRKEEAAKTAAWGEAGVIIQDLKGALADAQQQLRKERAARDQLEEDMKQSFMRSVCAINLEVRSTLPCTASYAVLLLTFGSDLSLSVEPQHGHLWRSTQAICFVQQAINLQLQTIVSTTKHQALHHRHSAAMP